MKTSLLLCSMDGMRPKLVLIEHEREWSNPVSGLRKTNEASTTVKCACYYKDAFLSTGAYAQRVSE